MNWGKVLRWSVVLFLFYCLITYPDSAAAVMHKASCELKEGANQFMRFLAQVSGDPRA